MVWTSLWIRARIRPIKRRRRENWWPAPSQTRVWDQPQESMSCLSPGVPGSSVVHVLNAGLGGAWEEGRRTGDLAGSLCRKEWKSKGPGGGGQTKGTPLRSLAGHFIWREEASSFVLAAGLLRGLGQPVEPTLPYFWITVEYWQSRVPHCLGWGTDLEVWV